MRNEERRWRIRRRRGFEADKKKTKKKKEKKMEEIRFRLVGFKKWGENLKSMRNEEKRRRNRRRRHETFNRRRRRRKLVGCGCVFIRVWAPLNRSEVYIYILKSSQFHCWHCDGYATAKKLGFKSCYFVANLLQILGRRNSIVEFATKMLYTKN